LVKFLFALSAGLTQTRRLLILLLLLLLLIFGLQVLTFDMGWVLQASCILQTTFYDRLLFTTIAPLVVMSLLTGMYLYVRRKLRRGGLPPLELRRFQRAAEKHEVALLLIMFLLYSTISTMVFQTFSCNDLEEVNKSYLRADYSIECGTPTHHAYCAYAAIMVIVYPVGIPLAYFLLLWRQREVLQRPAEKRKDELSIKKTSFLWEPYKSERYYWEVAECGRRILLTGFLVFMFAGSSAQVRLFLPHCKHASLLLFLVRSYPLLHFCPNSFCAHRRLPWHACSLSSHWLFFTSQCLIKIPWMGPCMYLAA
jgi:hypothetical protein